MSQGMSRDERSSYSFATLSGLFFCVQIATAAEAPATTVPPPAPNVAQAVYLDAYPLAKCLDGSPGLYYIRPAASAVNKTKFVVHIQGGGWCTQEQAHASLGVEANPHGCSARAQSRLGSSLAKYGNNATVDLGDVEGCDNNRWCGALMVNDPATNPLAYDWNAVFLYYCDGASWTGNQADRTEDGLYYRGWHNLEAAISDLLAHRGLDEATEVLIGGDSAGGLAAYYHLDHFATRIKAKSPGARVLGMPDSGWWPDDPQQEFTRVFTTMIKEQNGTIGLHAGCVSANPDNTTKCLFPQYFAHMIKTPMLPLQSIYDPLQKGSDPQSHGEWIAQSMNRSVLARGSNYGLWLHSCERHCGSELLTIDGVTYPRAVEQFWYSGISNQGGRESQAKDMKKRLWFQKSNYPCASCCNDGGV